MYEYLLWLFFFVLLPLSALWLWKWYALKSYAFLLPLTAAGSILFSFPWDYIAIRERIWYFTEPQIIGIWLFGLPIEEWLFIVLVTWLFSSITVLLWERYGVWA